MSTSPVMSITDELLAELEAAADAIKEGGSLQGMEAEEVMFNFECMATPATVKALLAHIVELKRDAERLNRLDRIGYAYGFEDMHEGSRWMIDGPFSDIRAAIDAMEPTP